MKTKFNKGNELDKQIYQEGTPTWGLKEGFLAVEDVRAFLEEITEPLSDLTKPIDRKEFYHMIWNKAGKRIATRYK
jgi:hypothetical protein